MAPSLTHKLFSNAQSHTLNQPKLKPPSEGFTNVQPTKISSPYVTKAGKLVVPLHVPKSYIKK